MVNISEEKLRGIVARVLRQIEAESAAPQPVEKKKIYLMCLESWDERYVGFLNEAGTAAESFRAQYEICALVPPSWRECGNETLLKSRGLCETKTYAKADEELLTKDGLNENTITVYPVVPYSLLAKAALCIDDTFESRWLSECIRQGGGLTFMSSGIPDFTGKEPEAYRSRILSYIRTVLEYGVEIAETFSPVMNHQRPAASRLGLVYRPKEEPKPETGMDPFWGQEPAAQVSVPRRRRIITASDVERAQVQGVITLYPGDQITDVARDRAKFLKLTVKRDT